MKWFQDKENMGILINCANFSLILFVKLPELYSFIEKKLDINITKDRNIFSALDNAEFVLNKFIK